MNRAEKKVYLQKYDFDCGSAVVACILLNLNCFDITYEQLMNALETNEEGTMPEKMADFLLLRCLQVTEKEDCAIWEIKMALENGYMVVVDYQIDGTREEMANLECGHYSVVDSLDDEWIYFLNPGVYENQGMGLGRSKMKITEFEARWIDKDVRGRIYFRWMLKVLM